MEMSIRKRSDDCTLILISVGLIDTESEDGKIINIDIYANTKSILQYSNALHLKPKEFGIHSISYRFNELIIELFQIKTECESTFNELIGQIHNFGQNKTLANDIIRILNELFLMKMRNITRLFDDLYYNED